MTNDDHAPDDLRAPDEALWARVEAELDRRRRPLDRADLRASLAGDPATRRAVLRLESRLEALGAASEGARSRAPRSRTPLGWGAVAWGAAAAAALLVTFAALDLRTTTGTSVVEAATCRYVGELTLSSESERRTGLPSGRIRELEDRVVLGWTLEGEER